MEGCKHVKVRCLYKQKAKPNTVFCTNNLYMLTQKKLRYPPVNPPIYRIEGNDDPAILRSRGFTSYGVRNEVGLYKVYNSWDASRMLVDMYECFVGQVSYSFLPALCLA